jgi:hypothetical protein
MVCESLGPLLMGKAWVMGLMGLMGKDAQHLCNCRTVEE